MFEGYLPGRIGRDGCSVQASGTGQENKNLVNAKRMITEGGTETINYLTKGHTSRGRKQSLVAPYHL